MPLRICLISDFFYPSMGGVENHVYQLSQCLLRQGHKVIVVTHRYGERCGVRWLANGLKVYYLPFCGVHDRVVLPTGLALLPILRDVLIRERIEMVHAHAVCTMALEAVTLCSLMEYRVVYTEHSNFGMSSASDINLNALERFVLSLADTVITVSHTSKENVALRCHLDPSLVYVIPNAIDPLQFSPDPDNVSPKDTVNIVVMMRLVWRKGTHLLVELIPEVCRRFPYVHFIVGGDGPNRGQLEEMRDRHQLQERVELLGAVAHCDVPRVLTRGHIFLNTSLTEAFCIAILEAVACGLRVVSTKVGGVPEILPRHMLQFAEPNADALLACISGAISSVRHTSRPTSDAAAFHRDVSAMYSWHDVARRTVRVYEDAARLRPRPSFGERLRLLADLGPVAGPLAILTHAVQFLFLSLLRACYPAHAIEHAPDFPLDAFSAKRGKPAPLPLRRPVTKGGGGGTGGTSEPRLVVGGVW
jgi:phosphatidylinositol glycan class A protein